ncbi:hypothetical protein ACVLD2_003579 [Paenibacillus sp. PvR052]
MSATRAVTNAEAAALAVLIRILNGNTRKVVMESSLDWGEA